MAESAPTTPMMRQYRQIKSQLPDDTLLLFRLGDFYEMFYADAQVASGLLDIALTSRNKIPMCGVPHHALDQYLAKLVRAGRKVAVCDQVEDASAARGIVRRDITGIVTPGTATVESVLESNRNNYLAGLHEAEGRFALALLDLSTGAFRVEETASLSELRETLSQFAPSECAMPSQLLDNGALSKAIGIGAGTMITACEDWTFEYDAAYDLLIRHFAVHSLVGFGCEGRSAMVGAAGGVLYYVKEQLRRSVGHVRSIRVGSSADCLVLDEATRAHLDLVSGRGKSTGEPSSLLDVLDCTVTPMGGRMIREWLIRPLADIGGISARHDAVEYLCWNRKVLRELRDMLGEIRDMERIVARLTGGGNGRDLRALARSLGKAPGLKSLLVECGTGLLSGIDGRLVPLPELVDLVDRAVVDEPPATAKEGGLIRRGYRPELDELRDFASEGRKWLAEYQARERERTGIKNLKVRHNKVFGYYIEISKSWLQQVPVEYVRKQTLVNAERFITPEIKEYEQKIFGADERSVAMEWDIFSEVRAACVEQTVGIQEMASAVAQLDVLAAFADRAIVSQYVRPVMADGDSIQIRGGRHPVIEQIANAERFVPNDVLLDCVENQLLIITGPNMAGKSTFIRQVALIVIMAQAGSFVPALGARLSVVDRVFTRIGASDDLIRGRSTFMVEMQETANILNGATARSLIVLDEIGRGTSTFDGISIAWAVAEFLHNKAEVKAKTLFATHYHELTDLALTMGGVRNYNIVVREQGDKIVFLRKIAPGPADKSYGIHVARLAGLPGEVIDRAREILLNLEEGEFSEQGNPKLAKRRRRKDKFDPSQMTFLENTPR